MTWSGEGTATFVMPPMVTAQSADPLGENLLGNVSIQSARMQSGDRGLLFNYTLAGDCRQQTTTRLGGTNHYRLWAFGYALGLDQAPSAEVAFGTMLVGGSTRSRHLRFGTDRKIRVYGASSGVLNDPTKLTAIPTAGLLEGYVIIDPLTLSTVYIKIYEAGVEKDAFDTGLTPAQFFGSTSGDSFWEWGHNDVPVGGLGCQLYASDLSQRHSIAAADAPHLVAYPRLRKAGGIFTAPNSNGFYTGDWSVNGAATAPECVDEFPHDGDSTYIASALAAGSTLSRHTFKTSATNPVPSTPTPTIHSVQIQSIGRRDNADKEAGYGALARLAGTDLLNSNLSGWDGAVLGLTYQGRVSTWPEKPGGGAWARANFDANTLEVGVQLLNATLAASARVTQQPMAIVIYSTATLAAGTTPVAAAAGRRRAALAKVI